MVTLVPYPPPKPVHKSPVGVQRFESRTVVVPKNRPESRTSVSSRTEIDTFSFAPRNPKPVVAYYGSDPNSTKECASSWEYKVKLC